MASLSMPKDADERRKTRLNIAIAVVLGLVAVAVTLITMYRISQGDIGR